MPHRHKSNMTFAAIATGLLFFLPAGYLFYLAFQAYGGRACGQSFDYGCWPTEDYFAAFAALGAVFFCAGAAISWAIWRKRG
ncbi:hypothetical protein [Sphingomicrobium flavum]|uniref:hypothetical protein n=1 Tax=Sphingomicrobium flavum TaxID=1229164 RepID=UPI0021AE2A84|nr:hypothetical protein [Sphingomicrobium flavum]